MKRTALGAEILLPIAPSCPDQKHLEIENAMGGIHRR
jgi:hypothetical protein